MTRTGRGAIGHRRPESATARPALSQSPTSGSSLSPDSRSGLRDPSLSVGLARWLFDDDGYRAAFRSFYRDGDLVAPFATAASAVVDAFDFLVEVDSEVDDVH